MERANGFRLLLVDDDMEVLRLNQRFFSSKGYEVRVASSGMTALDMLKAFEPDCIVLDVMMPDMDGFHLLREIRQRSVAPVLFLTGRQEEEDKVRGLMLGADDYVVKPCGLPELEARIAANVRRQQVAGGAPSSRLFLPPLEIDVVGHQAYCNEKNLGLTNQEYDVLYLLANHPGELVPFCQLGEQLWRSYRPEDRRALMVIVSRLRKKLEHPFHLGNMVETVWSKGYRLVVRSR